MVWRRKLLRNPALGGARHSGEFDAHTGGEDRCGARSPRPKGIHWELLTEEKIEAIPALKEKRR